MGNCFKNLSVLNTYFKPQFDKSLHCSKLQVIKITN